MGISRNSAPRRNASHNPRGVVEEEPSRADMSRTNHDTAIPNSRDVAARKELLQKARIRQDAQDSGFSPEEAEEAVVGSGIGSATPRLDRSAYQQRQREATKVADPNLGGFKTYGDKSAFESAEAMKVLRTGRTAEQQFQDDIQKSAGLGDKSALFGAAGRSRAIARGTSLGMSEQDVDNLILEASDKVANKSRADALVGGESDGDRSKAMWSAINESKTDPKVTRQGVIDRINNERKAAGKTLFDDSIYKDIAMVDTAVAEAGYKKAAPVAPAAPAAPADPTTPLRRPGGVVPTQTYENSADIPKATRPTETLKTIPYTLVDKDGITRKMGADGNEDISGLNEKELEDRADAEYFKANPATDGELEEVTRGGGASATATFFRNLGQVGSNLADAATNVALSPFRTPAQKVAADNVNQESQKKEADDEVRKRALIRESARRMQGVFDRAK